MRDVDGDNEYCCPFWADSILLSSVEYSSFELSNAPAVGKCWECVLSVLEVDGACILPQFMDAAPDVGDVGICKGPVVASPRFRSLSERERRAATQAGRLWFLLFEARSEMSSRLAKGTSGKTSQFSSSKLSRDFLDDRR